MPISGKNREINRSGVALSPGEKQEGLRKEMVAFSEKGQENSRKVFPPVQGKGSEPKRQGSGSATAF